jgi:hypothetical protein
MVERSRTIIPGKPRRSGAFMQEQDIKRGHTKDVEGEKLGALVSEIFGNCEHDGDKFVVTFGALAPLTVWIKDKSTLCVDTKMKTDVDEATAIETRKRYNDFMFRATGFTAQQRSKRLQQKAKGGDL